MSLNSTAGDAAAESYFAIADADAYFTNRGIAAWTGTTPVKEAAARLGTQYLDNAYRLRWKGITATKVQSLAWPRVEGTRNRRPYYGAFYPMLDENGWQLDPAVVPVQVQRAAMEAALLALSGTSLESMLVRGNAVKSQKDAVDVISTETVWQDGAPTIDRYRVIEGYLSGLVDSSPGAQSGNITLVRG